MTQGDEDKLWADIVARYDEAPAAADVPEAETVTPAPEAVFEPLPLIEPAETWNPVPFTPDAEEGFVPPVPPKVQLPEPPRLIAWCGVIGAPAVFLLFLILGITLPSWASTLLIISFLGGFVFLVATMRNEPRDPYDDGARV